MPDPSLPKLRTFLDELRRRGDLVEIDAPVDPRFEAPEIHRRVIAAGGPALLFKRPVGAKFPLATNLFGTAHRAELAFGQRPAQLLRRLVEVAETLMPPTPRRLWEARDLGAAALKIGFKSRRRGPVTEVIRRDVDLGELPILTTWERDGGPFVTLPLVYTEHPEGKGSNLAIYRLHVHDERTTGMHWQIGKGGGFHYQIAEERDQALPATVFVGGPPALILAAIAPLPENVPEILLASLLAGERLKRVPGPSPHPLLAEAEFALVGHVPPHLRRPEGPFGDHYGYYSLIHDYPVFEVDALCHRKDAIYPATVVGKPRQEDFFIGDLLQDLLSPLFPLVMPGVVDLWSYGETGYHSLAAAVVKDRYRREAMVSAFRILGEGQLALTKFLFVTDRRVDLRDFKATLVHVLERSQPETDLYVFGNLSMDTLDYTGPVVNRGSKGVWLGLGEAKRELPREFSSSELPHGIDTVEVFCPGCLVIGGSSMTRIDLTAPARGELTYPAGPHPPAGADDAADLRRIASHPAFAHWPLLILVDEPLRAVASTMNFLWTTFTRFEPATDIHAADATIVANHVTFRPPILIDARLATGFPTELQVSEDLAKRVDERWLEYFPDGGVEMGDSAEAHLDPPRGS
jgi:UbiD family decarboxylase